MPDPDTQRYYQTHAADLARCYAGGGLNLNGLFQAGDSVLDIGCGSGRDLLLLLQAGINAFGCDPSPAMLDQARASLREAGYAPEERLLPAALPDLAPYAEESLDGILCSAVFMHLPREHHFDALFRLHRLLKPGGTLQLSFPLNRPGLDPETSRDADGRLFLSLDPDELTLLCERIGFQRLSHADTADSLGREGIRWCRLGFRRPASR